MNGILLVNKPKGITSHDVVAKLRRVLSTKAVGHAGTLDPMAQGLLILLLGEATKFSNYIMGQDKKYSAEIQLGIETDSWDAEGELLTSAKDFEQKKLDFSEDDIKSVVESLKGDLNFQVPVHSAIKIKGKKLYDYARQGKAIQVPTRLMKFYKAQYKGSRFNDYYIHGTDFKTQIVSVDLECEKGSYIRSWVHHFGQNLGCGAMMSGLIRHQSGDFALTDSVDYNLLLEIEQHQRDIKNFNLSKNISTNISKLDADSKLEAPETEGKNGFLHMLHSESVKTKLEESLKFKLDHLTKKIIDLETCIHGPFYRVFESEIKLLQNGQVPNDLNLRVRPLVKICQYEDKSQLVRIFNSDLSKLVAVLELTANSRPKIIRAFQN